MSGAFGAGRVAAIMGPSGAGKTTLLNVLAGRTTTSIQVSGDVVIARAKPTDVVRKRYTGYCEQHDSLIDVLSVREMLEYTAELKCSQYLSHSTKIQRVDELLNEMGLAHIASSQVSVISGGERKRTSIALALVSKPPVLLLDEPTTGLDAATADDVLGAVKKLARDGSRVVACTIHAPSSRAFRLLIDDVVALDGGKVAWAAPPGEGSHGPLATYVSQSLGSVYIDGDSLAEHLLYAMRDAKTKNIDVSEKWCKHPVYAATLKRVQYLASKAETEDPDAAAQRLREACPGSLAWTKDDPRRKLAVATSVPHGIITLLRYRSLRSFGDVEYIMTRLGDKLLYGLVMMSLFWGEGQKKRQMEAAMNSAGVLWFAAVLTGYGAACYMPQLVSERPIFLRETADGAYLPVTFLIAKTIEECVIILPFALVYFAAVFFSVGLQGNFLISFGLFYLTVIIGLAIAQMVAAFAPDADAANALLPTYITCNLLSSGYVLLTSDIPLGWRWYTRINHLYYAWMALLRDNFSYESAEMGSPNTDVLDHYDVRRAPTVGVCALALVLFFLVYLCLAERGLTALARSRR